MAANTNPIYSKSGLVGTVTVPQAAGANTKSDGTGTIATDMWLAASPAADGSWLDRIRFSHGNNTVGEASGANVYRLYLSTKNAGATAPADTKLIKEIASPTQNSDHATVPTNFIEEPLGFVLPSGMYLLVSIHANTSAHASLHIVTFGGNY
jgi:hypothetical protein